nr:hypothetical protein [Rubrobacter sp.]
MNVEGRIRRLEGEHAEPEETPAEVEQRRQALRRDAEHINYCRDKDEPPIFEITAGGDVVCAVDGRPVTDPRQILAERFY